MKKKSMNSMVGVQQKRAIKIKGKINILRRKSPRRS